MTSQLVPASELTPETLRRLRELAAGAAQLVWRGNEPLTHDLAVRALLPGDCHPDLAAVAPDAVTLSTWTNEHAIARTDGWCPLLRRLPRLNQVLVLFGYIALAPRPALRALRVEVGPTVVAELSLAPLALPWEDSVLAQVRHLLRGDVPGNPRAGYFEPIVVPPQTALQIYAMAAAPLVQGGEEFCLVGYVVEPRGARVAPQEVDERGVRFERDWNDRLDRVRVDERGQLVHEWVAAYEAGRDRPRAPGEHGAVATQRAQEILFRHLTAAQRRQWESGGFEVCLPARAGFLGRGGRAATCFWVPREAGDTIRELRHHGGSPLRPAILAEYCLVAAEPLPEPDVALTRKLLLEHDLPRFLATAVRV